MTDLDDYNLIPCPISGCEATLHVTFEAARTLYLSDLRNPEDVRAVDADQSTWKVACYCGHVLVLPSTLGCPEGCDDTPCPHGEFDYADESRTFRAHDMARLRDMLAAFEVMAR